VERNAVAGNVPDDVRPIRGRRSDVVLAHPCCAKSARAPKASRRRRWQTLVHRGAHL